MPKLRFTQLWEISQNFTFLSRSFDTLTYSSIQPAFTKREVKSAITCPIYKALFEFSRTIDSLRQIITIIMFPVRFSSYSKTDVVSNYLLTKMNEAIANVVRT